MMSNMASQFRGWTKAVLLAAAGAVFLTIMDGMISYMLSITLQLEAFLFLGLRFFCLFFVATLFSIVILRSKQTGMICIYITMLFLAMYYVLAIHRIYGSETIDIYTVVTDPIVTSYLPMVIAFLYVMGNEKRKSGKRGQGVMSLG